MSARYEILGELGRGGMGVVYRARDRETGDLVALKALRPEIAANVAVLERFKNELLLARKITHKNVCRTYELLRFGDTVVIAMEYVEGRSLRAYLETGAGVSVSRGLDWARQICDGLREAHAQGVVHRDLKPENILIDRRGQVKVMDFGIARSLATPTTQTGTVIGTPAYMAPEQAEGKPVDQRTDLYSLGLILYEMFTGRPTFSADTPLALAHKQVHDTPPPARSMEPFLPEFLDRAIGKCLEKDPKKRFQSVAELEAALREEAPAATDLEGQLVPPQHLCVWGTPDWVLLVLGVVGLIYFLNFRDTVFPASRMSLDVDAITARREAEDLAKRLGTPFPEIAHAQLEYHAERYPNRLFAQMFDERGRKGSFETLAQVELPLYWRVTFKSPAPRDLTEGPPPEGFALASRKGKVEEYSNPFTSSNAFLNYHPATIEQRREIAKNAVEQVCGSVPANLALVETSGGDRDASYTAAWKRIGGPGRPPWAEGSLSAEKVTGIKCYPQEETPPENAVFVLGGPARLASLCRILVLGFLGMLVVAFGIGRCHQSPVLWKRLPVAAFLGFSAVWLLVIPFFSSIPSWYLLLVGAVAASSLFLVAMVAVEHFLTRRSPALVASYLLVLSGRWQEPSVGLAVVRGALAGLVLVAVETGLVHLTVHLPGPWGAFANFINPTAIGQAAASFNPALFVVASAFFHGIAVGLIFVGAVWAVFYKMCQKELAKGVGSSGERAAASMAGGIVGGAVYAATSGLQLHFGQGWGFGSIYVPVLLGYLLSKVVVRYDILTVVVAVGTSVLWILNYPLLRILEPVGNSVQWGIFVAWGTLVVTAALVAFWPALVRARQQMRFE